MLIEQLLSDDAPIRTLSNDLLGRRPFIESLASALLLPPGSHCRVVSLEGAWGEGKTSTIEMALDVIGLRDADLKPFVVRVNPWQLGTKDALVRALLLELSKIVRGESRRQKGRSFAKLADELLKYSNALSALKAEPHGFVLVSVARISLWFAAKFARRDSDLQSLKKRVSEAIEKSKRPIIVVVDDLDRLLPQEVVEVIRFVRAVGDFERTTYLLAYDHPRIIEALTQAGIPSAARFLEKIVQLRTHLPPANADAIRRILDSKIEASDVYKNRRLFDESESRRVELYSFYVAPIVRDVRTLLRVLARVELTPMDVVREVEYWEVFALNVVSVVAPDIFEFIRLNPTSFTNSKLSIPATHGGEDTSAEELGTHLDSLIAAAPNRTGHYVKGLLRSLFPLLNKRTSRSQSWMDRNGRIAAERPLLTYLLSGVLEGQLPLDTVRAIVTEDRFREERISVSSQQEEHFLSLVSAIRDEIVVSKLFVKDPADLAMTLLNRALELPHPEPGLGFKIQDRSIQMLPLFVELMVRDGSPSKALSRLIREDQDGLLASLLLEELASPENEAMSELRTSISNAEMQSLTGAFAAKVYTVASNYTGSDEPRMGPLLFALRRIDKVEFEKLAQKLIPSQKHRRVLIRSLANSIYSSAHGRVAVWSPDLLSESLTDFLREEANKIVSESTQDKALLAGARALLEGKEIVVDSGEHRESRG